MHNARPSWHAKYPPHWSHRQALPRHRSRCDEIANHTPVQNAAELRTSPGLWVPGHYEHATGWPIHTRYELGRASCRERVWQYVWISGVAGSLKKKKKKRK